MTNQMKAVSYIKDLRAKGPYEPACIVRDILADLMHYCDYKEISFGIELRIAEGHYTEEVIEDQDDYIDNCNRN